MNKPLTATQKSIMRLKQGQKVGFKNSAGMLRSLGGVNNLPKGLREKVKGKK